MNLLLRSLSIALILFLSSCGSGSEQKNVLKTSDSSDKVYKKVRMVQVDSIMIDVIGNIDFYDYQPQSKLFLGGDLGPLFRIVGAGPKFNELGYIVVNREGEVLHQFNCIGDGPEEHGKGVYNSFFLGPDKIGVMGKPGLFQYNIDGSFEKKYRDINMKNVAGFSMGHFGFSKTGKKLAIGLPIGMNESAEHHRDSIFQVIKPLWFYDLEKSSENGKELVMTSFGYPDDPVYAPGSKLPHSAFPPKMALNHKKNQLYAVYPEIPSMAVYNAENGHLVDEVDLKPDHFEFGIEIGKATGGIKGYEGLLWENRGGRMANSGYHEIIQLGDHTLLRYSSAIPLDIINKLVSGPGYRKSEDWPRIRRKYYRFYYQLIKNGEKVLPDFELPILEPQEGDMEFINNAFTHGKIIGGNGLSEIFVFIPNQGDVERDYELIRVFKLELLEE